MNKSADNANNKKTPFSLVSNKIFVFLPLIGLPIVLLLEALCSLVSENVGNFHC